MSEDEDHDELVVALQDVMLPTGVPVLPDVNLSARYSLPGGAEEAAGNWFDVVPLPGGRLALVVGEAVGTGMASAAAMGQLRAVIRAGLERHHEPVAALQLADVYARTSDDARGTAVVAAVLDPASGTLTHVTAGHPPPVLATLGSTRSHTLASSRARFLGAGDEFTSHKTAVGRGDLVLLTCAAPFRLVDEVADVVDEHRGDDLETMTDDLLSTFTSLSDQEAVTLLVAEVRTEPHPDLALTLPAGEQARRTSREHLTAWLEQMASPQMDALAIIHATGEIVANAVEHAHAGRRATSDGEVATIAQLRVSARLCEDGEVRVEVVDDGAWRTPGDNSERGRGLAMAAGLVDRLRVIPGTGGTRVVLTHRLSRPVHIERGTGAELPRRAVEVVHPAPGEIVLIGHFGHDDVERVTAEVLMVSRGGTRAVSVDLDQVTHLSSSAIRMLNDLADEPGLAPVRLLAAAGSHADRALEVSAVPHDAA